MQYWHAAETPPEITDLTETFRVWNPGMPHLLFSETEAEEFIADQFTTRELLAFRACAVPAMQADYFRYCAVLALGGIYVDADYRCQRSLQELVPEAGASRLFSRSRGGVANGFFIFTTAGHQLLRLTVDMATHNIERRAAERIWTVTGPAIFTILAAIHRRVPAAMTHVELNQGILFSAFNAVGGYERLGEAFDDVSIEPIDAVKPWIGVPQAVVDHRPDYVHWLDWQKQGLSIFR